MANIYVDSCLIISLVEGTLSERLLLSKCLDEHFIYSSELARLETRVLAIRKGNQASFKKFEQFSLTAKWSISTMPYVTELH